MGLRNLAFVNSVAEVTPGTTPAMPDYARWMGVINATWHEERTKDRPEELHQSLARYFRSTTMYKLATLDVEATCTFEDINFILQMGVKTTTPTADMGMPNPAQTWRYLPTLTAADSPRTYTLQVGDDTACYKMPYSFARNFEISFAIGERTRLRANIVGRELISDTAAAGLAERPVEPILGQGWIASFVDAGTGVDTTDVVAYTGCVVNGTWRLPQAYVPHRCIDGTITFTKHQAVALAPELELTVEFDAAANALRAKYATDNRQLIRLRNLGSQIHAGTPAVNRRLTIDGAYQCTDFGAIGGSDQDGVQTVRYMASGEYDPDWAELFEIESVIADPGTGVYLP